MARYLLAIDQGTTGTTVMIVDEEARVTAKVTHEFPQVYPQPGWVEHDPEAIWTSVLSATGEALATAKVAPVAIGGIGIANQRETAVIWDRHSGQPVHRAIVWQDRRTAEHCRQLQSDGLTDLFRRRTGLVIDPYFSGTKITWLLDHVDGLRARASAGELAFGTIDSFLIWRLTGGMTHATEISNASRTLMFNIHRMEWDAELTEQLRVPRELLPEVRGSSEIYGTTRDVEGLPDGIPVAGAAGDQQAALFGQACYSDGDAKCTYGTGAFLLINTGHEPIASESGVLTTVAWKIDNEVTYALEGSAFVAGAAVQWLRDGLGLIGNAAEIEDLARQVPNSHGVVFVPALAGLGAPHWRPEARGIISGITRGTTAAHLARATLEGIALQIHDLAAAMAKDTGHSLTSFKADGGAAANDLLLQLQADLLEMEIIRPQVIETTALGAAFLAGLATGIWKDTDTIRAGWTPQARFIPQMNAAERAQMRQHWARAISLVL